MWERICDCCNRGDWGKVTRPAARIEERNPGSGFCRLAGEREREKELLGSAGWVRPVLPAGRWRLEWADGPPADGCSLRPSSWWQQACEARPNHFMQPTCQCSSSSYHKVISGCSEGEEGREGSWGMVMKELELRK